MDRQNVTLFSWCLTGIPIFYCEKSKQKKTTGARKSNTNLRPNGKVSQILQQCKLLSQRESISVKVNSHLKETRRGKKHLFAFKDLRYSSTRYRRFSKFYLLLGDQKILTGPKIMIHNYFI